MGRDQRQAEFNNLEFLREWREPDMGRQSRMLGEGPAAAVDNVEYLHCKKRFSGIPVPSRDVTYQALPGRE